MDYSRIINLIDKYWEGETSLEEEREIRSFFNGNPVLPESLEQHRRWFSGVEEIASAELGDDFDERILSEIARRSEQETHPAEQTFRKAIFRSWRIIAASVAASLLFFLGWNQFTAEEQPEMTYAEAQEAMLLVKDVLYFTSSKLNEAENITRENLGKIDVINEYVKINK